MIKCQFVSVGSIFSFIVEYSYTGIIQVYTIICPFCVVQLRCSISTFSLIHHYHVLYSHQLYSAIVSSAAIDCGDPGTPTNGQRSLSSTTYNSVVTYTCDVGYTLQGSNSRTCQSDGQWSESVPQCNRKLICCCILCC